MKNLTYTNHAEARMRQRGIRESDVDLVMDCGALIGKNTYFLRRKDVDREIRKWPIQTETSKSSP